ncbi:MAG: hypothetical protein E3K37_10345 [Candidatus Kuenenia sp.]|nr:hypothetical protein [Candidatus Kuenenia hertensis]
MKERNCIFSVLIVLLLPFCFTFSLFAQGLKDKPSDKVVNQKIKKLQIQFIANEGQTDEKVKFYANTFPHMMWLILGKIQRDRIKT